MTTRKIKLGDMAQPPKPTRSGNRHQRRAASAIHRREQRHIAEALAACRKIAPDFKLQRIDRPAPTEPKAREYGWAAEFTLGGRLYAQHSGGAKPPAVVGPSAARPDHFRLIAAKKALRVMRGLHVDRHSTPKWLGMTP